MKYLFAILLPLLTTFVLPAHAAAVRVAVAANFLQPMQEIAARFSRETGHSALLTSGSSGKIYAQIKNGAPFGIFLSADADKPARLEQEGLAVAGSRFTYAQGALALWSADPGLIRDGAEILHRAGFRHLALANPRLAPYGVAALETLESLDVKQRLAGKFVRGENIAQTYQFVATGNAELGFVAVSQITVEGKLKGGSAWLVPAGLHRPIRQDAVLLLPARDNPAAKALLEYLRSDAAGAIIARYGYHR
ncbi:MAG TPA: molybdate ABC transporter substrate-binding protein [Gammaproteobacteria bacterium]|nr:molybdate ABC transporter substrate-binding protein [Gammaproteobacteria bacterium]